MLKMLKPTSDERAAADLLRWFAGSGAVRLYAADADALLMERADNEVSLKTMAISGDDDRAAEILADCVKQLHAPRESPVPSGLTPLREWFRSLFARQAQLPILAQCADVAQRLLAAEHESTVLHGDLHHDNVLHSVRGWLAIDPKGLIGERTYEVANLLGNPWPHGEIVHQPGRMLRLAELYAQAAWTGSPARSRLCIRARRIGGELVNGRWARSILSPDMRVGSRAAGDRECLRGAGAGNRLYVLRGRTEEASDALRAKRYFFLPPWPTVVLP